MEKYKSLPEGLGGRNDAWPHLLRNGCSRVPWADQAGLFWLLWIQSPFATSLQNFITLKGRFRTTLFLTGPGCTWSCEASAVWRDRRRDSGVG